MQAQAVRDFVDTLLVAEPGAMVMVTGDLNDFQFGEHDEGPDDPVAILEGVGGGALSTNLIEGAGTLDIPVRWEQSGA